MDRDLVVRAREGDRDAFSRLATASIGRLNFVARLIVRDDGRAEDLDGSGGDVNVAGISVWVTAEGPPYVLRISSR